MHPHAMSSPEKTTRSGPPPPPYSQLRPVQDPPVDAEHADDLVLLGILAVRFMQVCLQPYREVRDRHREVQCLFAAIGDAVVDALGRTMMRVDEHSRRHVQEVLRHYVNMSHGHDAPPPPTGTHHFQHFLDDTRTYMGTLRPDVREAFRVLGSLAVNNMNHLFGFDKLEVRHEDVTELAGNLKIMLLSECRNFNDVDVCLRFLLLWGMLMDHVMKVHGLWIYPGESLGHACYSAFVNGLSS